MILTEGRWGDIITESNDKGPYKLVRVQSEGHEFDAIVIESYGMQASPIEKGQVFVLPCNTDNGQAVALVLPPPAKRVDQQKPGEVSIKNHVSGNRTYMDNDGDTRSAMKRDSIVSPERHAITNAKQDSVERPGRHHHIQTGGLCLINCGGAPAPGATTAKLLEV